MRIRSIGFAFLVVVLAGSGSSLSGQRGRGGEPAEPSAPTPRHPDGRPNLGALPGETGVWVGNGGRLAINPNNYEARATLGAPIHIDDVPLKPWARAIVDERHITFLSYEPHARCKPSGGAREFVTPYGLEIVDLPEIQRVYIFDFGGPHTYRVIYMDGRPHPENPTPSYYGHSVGRWEGDTLVVDTVGFNERFWMNRDGLPHTDRMHLIERITRTDFDTLQYDITIDDPAPMTPPGRAVLPSTGGRTRRSSSTSARTTIHSRRTSSMPTARPRCRAGWCLDRTWKDSAGPSESCRGQRSQAPDGRPVFNRFPTLLTSNGFN